MKPLQAISLVKVVQDDVFFKDCLLKVQLKAITMAVFKVAPNSLCVVFGGFKFYEHLPLYDFSLRYRSEGGIISELVSDVHVFANLIKKVIDDDYSVDTVVGYSMGGILAYYYAFYYGNGNPNLEVITFGAPRPGDENFNNSYDRLLKNQTYRFYLEKDWVTHIPAFKYWHLGLPCNAEKPMCVDEKPEPNEDLATFYVPTSSGDIDAKEEWERTIGGWLPDSFWFVWIWYPIMLIYWVLQRVGWIKDYHSVESYYEALRS